MISLWPLLGFWSNKKRAELPINAFCGPSRNLLFRSNKIRRRAGSDPIGDTSAGYLESAWGALGRRIISASLASLQDSLPTWLVLYCNRATKSGQLAFRSTNGIDATRVVGAEYGGYHYSTPVSTRADQIPTFRVMPFAYRNEYGGLTLSRLGSASDRQHLCGGSQDVVQVDAEGVVAWPGRFSAPGRWNGRFNDSVSSGDEYVEVAPLGMVMPLQMPKTFAGNNLGPANIGPFKGSNAFFYSVIFENKDGELSMYPIPRGPNSAWAGFAGFGYCHVDSLNPTDYFDSVSFVGLPKGPPGTVVRHIIRSTMVQVTTTSDVSFPSSGALYFCARIENNSTADFVLYDGNDFSLDTSPVPVELRKLVWPPCGSCMGRFDGRFLIGGDLTPNPVAMLAAPWDDGNINFEIDDVAAYTGDAFYVAVKPTEIVVRRVSAGLATDRSVAIGSRTLRDMVDWISTSQTTANVIVTGSYNTSNASIGMSAVAGALLSVGDVIDSSITAFPVGTRITAKSAPFILQIIYVSHSPSVNAYGASITFNHVSVDTSDPSPWGLGVVPGADALEPAEQLLRTLAEIDCSWGNADTTLQVTAGDLSLAEYITPGMKVYHGDFAAGTIVTAVDSVTGIVTVSNASGSANAGASEEVKFAYDTGDAITPSSESVAATGAPTDAVSSAQMVVTTQNNAAGTTDANDATLLLVTYTATGAPPVIQTASERFAITAITASVIYGVRVSLRVKTVHTSGAPFVSFSPFINGVAYGVPQTVATGSFHDIVFDFPNNPVTGLAWTKALIDSYSWGVAVNALGTVAGDATGITVSKVLVGVVTANSTEQPGFIRSYGNCLPAPIFWRMDYLNKFDPRPGAMTMTIASPGRAQNAINSWAVGNGRTGNGGFGRLTGFADMGSQCLVFFARGRMRLWNPRTGTTRADSDYTIETVSWNRGCRSPYALVSRGAWAIFLCEEGFFACGVDQGERLISEALYNPGNPLGERGELEYSILASVAASEADSDDYKVHASLVNSVVIVSYWSSASAGYPDRQVRYDFSGVQGKKGVSEVLDDRGQALPWSTPLTLRNSCCVVVPQGASEAVFAVVDSNAGTTSGRVDQIDTGTEDDGVAVVAVGYSGVEVAGGLNALQPTAVRVLTTGGSSGMAIGITREPHKEPDEASWDEISINPSPASAFGVSRPWLFGRAREERVAIAARLWDDGTGECSEYAQIIIDADSVEDTKQ